MAGATHDAAHLTRFRVDGFTGPVRPFTGVEWARVIDGLARWWPPAPADWPKGRAVTDPFMHWVATRPALVRLLTLVLGEDVVLWGASVVRRTPGQVHPWHTDIESAAPEGGFATVWIGVENTSPESGLQFISRSHRLGRTLQEAAHRHGCSPSGATTEMVLAWARECDPAAALERPGVGDGDALVFDGRLWHGSHHLGASGPRTALLLQYAAARARVRRPDFSRKGWPFRFLDAPPPVIVVHGTAPAGLNRVVPPPSVREIPMITSSVHPVTLPLAEDPKRGWRPYPLFHGPTRLVGRMGCHVSVLSPGHSPHPPHAHPEEEILIVLDGEAEIVLADDPLGANARLERLRAGSFAYYPSAQHHTLRNAGGKPVTYLMFKWLAGASGASRPMRTAVFDSNTARPRPGGTGFASVRLFEQPTASLGALHAHVSVVSPGGGYASHVDAHDVALVVLEGRIQTMGQTVGPFGVVYCSAGTAHGLENAGPGPARYLVLEFHAPGGGLVSSRRRRWLKYQLKYVVARLRDRWQRAWQ